MSELTNTQIPKPGDEQAFERANEVLWRCILSDNSVKTYARRGQSQDGVDLTGFRDGNPEQIVGIQAKLKGHEKTLEEQEVRDEVKKALKFTPALSEYIIVTTAPDSKELDSLALSLSQSASKDRGHPIKIRIFGWATLEREIRRFPEALNAFDPSHTPHGDRILRAMENAPAELTSAIEPHFADMKEQLDQIIAMQSAGREKTDAKVNAALESQINDYVELLKQDPATSLKLLQQMLDRLEASASNRVRYRVLANIAACQFALGDEVIAAEGFIKAYDVDPTHPVAASNKGLGLLIQKDLEALKKFAGETLRENPNDGALAGYLVQGLIDDDSVENALTYVPSEACNKSEFKVSYIRWLIERGAPGQWREYAREEYSRDPDVPGIREYCANSLLDQVLEQTGFEYGRELTDAERVDLTHCAELYEKIWKEDRDPKRFIRGEAVSVPLNLMLAYRLLQKIEEAVRVGSEALILFPGNDDVRERMAACLLETGDNATARDLVMGLPVNSDTVMMRFNIHMASGEWDEVEKLVTDHLDEFPPQERALARTSLTLAQVSQAAAEARPAIFEACKGKNTDDTRVNMLLAQSARENGLYDLSDHFFAVGLNGLENDSTHFSDRVAAAHEAIGRDEPGIAARVLYGHIALDRDSNELRLLAQAIAYDFPIRQRASQFFESLDPTVRSLPYYQRKEGVYHINRGAPEDAAVLFRAAFDSDKHLSNLMGLIGAHLRSGDKSAVIQLIGDEEMDTLSGSPVDKMNYCHVLLDFGFPERALNLGYKTVLSALDQSDVVMKFLGLVIKPSRVERISEVLRVRPGVHVRMTSSDGAEFTALIDEEADRAWGQAVAINNAFVSKSVGLSVGDTFEYVTAIGVEQTWTITEIKPRWLQACHTLTETFNQRFPEASGFATITMKEGDIQPTLDQVKRHSEAIQERAALYLDHGVPIAIAAGDGPGAVIGFSEFLVRIGEHIKTCAGEYSERMDALGSITSNNHNGAVVDALTAWRAAELGVFEVVEKQLGRLFIPSTELAKIKNIIVEQEEHPAGERMTMSYHEGQYFREVITEEDAARNLSILKRRLADIEAHCSEELVVLPDEMPEPVERLVDIAAGEVVAPMVMAGKDKLLLSDDMSSRQMSATVFGTKGVWLQAVLLHAFENGNLSLDDYSDALVLLSARRHNCVSVSSSTLYSVFQRDESQALHRLESLCTYIGGKNAEPRSHMALVAHFINEVWADVAWEEPRACKATSIVLRALLARNRGDDWAYWAAGILTSLSNRPRKYFREWCFGHFFSLDQADQIIKSVSPKPAFP